MGYESKIILGIPSSIVFDGVVHTQIVAMIDLSKAGHDGVGKFIAASVAAQREVVKDGAIPYGAYIHDGMEIKDDPYGDPLAPLDLDGLISAIEADNVEYRRFALALHILRGWRDVLPMFGGAENTVVLHYGY